MDRRRLLTLLTTIPVLGLLPASRGTAGVPELLIQQSPLAGFQYHEGERLWPRLRAGQAVRLVREADNPHDHQAVRVDWHRRKLGYIPARQNHCIAQMLDRGEKLTARISQLRMAHSPRDRIELEIYARPRQS